VTFSADLRPGGKLQPGQLISDPERPDETICERPYPLTDVDKIETENDSAQSFSTTTDGEGWGGLSLGILNILKLAWSGRIANIDHHNFEVEKLETQYFEPSMHYVKISLTQPEVLKHLDKNDSIFMITDVRIAHGATIVHEDSRAKSAKFKAHVPLSTLGMGPDVGGELGGKKDKHKKQVARISHSFIFAYRLRECRYDKHANTFVTSLYTRRANIQALGDDDDGELAIMNSDSVFEADYSAGVSPTGYNPSPENFDIRGLADDYTVLEGPTSTFKDDCILVGFSSELDPEE
jgi:hypothetical protein